MQPPKPTIDPLYLDYALLQLRRHYLLIDGKDDDEMEQVEEELTALWENLSEAQRQSLNGMGSDLNWIRRGGELSSKGPTSTDVSEQDVADLDRAELTRDWHAILHYLRICAPILLPESVAHIRATCYHELGLDLVAKVFDNFAATIPNQRQTSEV